MKFLFKLLMVVVLMVAAVVGFETLRLGSVDDAIDCVVQVLNVEELSEGLEDAVSDIDIPSLSGPRGTYYCGSNSLEFRSDGTVISTFLGLQEKGKFSMDGNEITYSTDENSCFATITIPAFSGRIYRQITKSKKITL